MLGLGFMLMGENSRDVTATARGAAGRDRARACPPVSTVDDGLRPHRPRRPGAPHRGARTSSRARSWSSPCSSPSSATSGPGSSSPSAIPLSMLFAVEPDAAIRDRRQPDEPRRDRLRSHRRQLGDHGRERGAAAGRRQRAIDRATRVVRGRRARGAHADDVRRADHHDRLPADPDPGGHRGQALPADGADGDLRAPGLAAPLADADAGARRALSCRGTAPRGSADSCEWLKRLYRPALRHALAPAARRPRWRRAHRPGCGRCSRRASAASSCPGSREGTIVINTVRLAGVSLDESVRYGTRIEQALLKAFPDEMRAVWTRTGTGGGGDRSDGHRALRHLHDA